MTNVSLRTRVRLAIYAEDYLDSYDDDRTLQLEPDDVLPVVLRMQDICGGDQYKSTEVNARRKTFLRCVFGKSSTKELYYCERDAFNRWVGENEMSFLRFIASAVVEEDARLKGQIAMPLDLIEPADGQTTLPGM